MPQILRKAVTAAEEMTEAGELPEVLMIIFPFIHDLECKPTRRGMEVTE